MMKQIFFIIFSFAVFSANGQSRDNKEVAIAVDALYQAMVTADKASLIQLISDSLSYGHSNGRIETRKEFIENVVSGKSDFVTVGLSEQTIAVKNNIAIVRHLLIASINDDGKPENIKLKVLFVFEKEKGKWKLIARQSVKLT